MGVTRPPVSVKELAPGQTIVRSSYTHGPAKVTSLDTGELYGSPTVIVDADEGGCWRRWIFYASEMVEVAE